jgi:hypothetical protein
VDVRGRGRMSPAVVSRSNRLDSVLAAGVRFERRQEIAAPEAFGSVAGAVLTSRIGLPDLDESSGQGRLAITRIDGSGNDQGRSLPSGGFRGGLRGRHVGPGVQAGEGMQRACAPERVSLAWFSSRPLAISDG